MFTPVLVKFASSRMAIVAILITVASGCGVVNQPRVQQRTGQQEVRQHSILDALNQAHNDWKGTPYILGGSGINGVDCSSFTQIVFKEYFGRTLPRNTRQQLKEGSSVRRNYVRPGDLIFFRTGRDLLHVGVAMDKGRFIHASLSSGVMISRLEQRYWASRYLATRRLL